MGVKGLMATSVTKGGQGGTHKLQKNGLKTYEDDRKLSRRTF
jgi:hypothetical protein